IFLANANAQSYWKLGQQLIRALNQTTQEGFLYRVDMRLRPWGRSGWRATRTVFHGLSCLYSSAMVWLWRARRSASACSASASSVGWPEPAMPSPLVSDSTRLLSWAISWSSSRRGCSKSRV
ncbi:MAG: hypothetical protein HRU13_12020, partial [Phycisphaerales bacterium]|nr:hypothetical protein [Phycisphaerales bacterium]